MSGTSKKPNVGDSAGRKPDHISVGMIGAGVVGAGILRLLEDNASSIRDRLGAPIEVRRVVARDRTKDRPDIDSRILTFEASEVLDDPSIDVVVEVMGGLEPAGDYLRRAIDNGKQVVTANKALLAEHGNELAALAEARGVDLYFEAAVAGGIPIIRLLREALSSDRILSLRGIVNGTSNYILSRMVEDGLAFADALTEAQRAGFAEADPTLDVGGGDAAHKLTLLATLAYGARLTPSDIPTEGIEAVSATDIVYADRFGYVVKPLAIARPTEAGELDLRVHPALVPKGTMLATVGGALNAVLVQGAMVGPCLTSGLGAGAAPTAMSVVSDIVDVSRNLLSNARGRVPARAFLPENVREIAVQPIGKHVTRFYLRFTVRDRPGILARVAGILGAFDVSIEQLVQEGRGEGEAPVTIVMLTHVCEEQAIRGACREMGSLQDMVAAPSVLRIEDAD